MASYFAMKSSLMRFCSDVSGGMSSATRRQFHSSCPIVAEPGESFNQRDIGSDDRSLTSETSRGFQLLEREWRGLHAIAAVSETAASRARSCIRCRRVDRCQPLATIASQRLQLPDCIATIAVVGARALQVTDLRFVT